MDSDHCHLAPMKKSIAMTGLFQPKALFFKDYSSKIPFKQKVLISVFFAFIRSCIPMSKQTHLVCAFVVAIYSAAVHTQSLLRA